MNLWRNLFITPVFDSITPVVYTIYYELEFPIICINTHVEVCVFMYCVFMQENVINLVRKN